MKNLSKIILFIGVIGSTLLSNPISMFDIPAISEVYWVSPTEWYIEIDGSVCLEISGESPPCTSSAFSLFIDNSPNVSGRVTEDDEEYPVTLIFNDKGYAVLSRESLSGIPEQVPVEIQNDVSIRLLYSGEAPYFEYWSFQLRKTAPGNSLVTLENFEEPFETSRRSLGSRGNYSTRYEITVLDKNAVPIPGLRCGLKCEKQDNFSNFLTVGDINDKGLVTFDIPLSAAEQTIRFSLFDYSAGQSSQHTPFSSACQCNYSQADTLRKARCTLPVTYYELTVCDKDFNVLPKLIATRTYCPEDTDPSSSLCDSGYVGCEYFPPSSPDQSATTLYKIRVYEKESPVTFSFFREVRYDYRIPYDASWTGTYFDTSEVLRDTVIITPVQSEKRPMVLSGKKAGLTALPAGNDEILFVVTTPEALYNAAVSLFTLSGKCLKKQHITLDGAGTHTVKWQSGQISRGSYICRLETGRDIIATEQIVLR